MTVAKNTNRAKKAIENAREIRCYSLWHGFRGVPLPEQPVIWGGEIVNNQYTKPLQVTQTEFLRCELNGHNAKLVAGENGRYCLQIHSNLWYEFVAD